jgi:hypothetical protein
LSSPANEGALNATNNAAAMTVNIIFFILTTS